MHQSPDAEDEGKSAQAPESVTAVFRLVLARRDKPNDDADDDPEHGQSNEDADGDIKEVGKALGQGLGIADRSRIVAGRRYRRLREGDERGDRTKGNYGEY